LNGENDLNLEQVDRVSDYFEMSVEESEFLILLNQENRAGSKSLRQKLSKMIEESKSRNTRLNKKLAITDQISLEDQTVYYSH
ncbi:MAG: hypothetical protein NT027_00115, partial [Proteobacteria bacterium]|nr:hypothetical protein [Pseudomonadota bacterium]